MTKTRILKLAQITSLVFSGLLFWSCFGSDSDEVNRQADLCKDIICLNSGYCVNGACVCSENWTGADCSQPKPKEEWVWEWELIRNETNQIQAGIVYSTCGDQTNEGTINIRWKVASSGPVDIVVTTTDKDRDAFVASQSYNHYPSLASFGSLNYNREARIAVKACKVVHNKGASPVNITQEYWAEVYKKKLIQ